MNRPPPPSKSSFHARVGAVEELDHDEAEMHEETLHHEEVWLVSYADMMTLLFGFFVILFSMSTLDDKKFESVRKDSSEQFGGQYQLPTEEVRREVMESLSTKGVENKDIVVTQTLGGLEFDLKGGAFFESGSAALSPKTVELVNSIYDSLKKNKNKYSIRVEGHTDDVPISTAEFKSNWELSAGRAIAVIKAFEEKGWKTDWLEAIGYGSSRPLVPNRTKDGQAIPENMAKNRRVVIKIVKLSTQGTK